MLQQSHSISQLIINKIANNTQTRTFAPVVVLTPAPNAICVSNGPRVIANCGQLSVICAIGGGGINKLQQKEYI
jgi:hypothetical protein